MSEQVEMLTFVNPGTGEQFGQVPMASAEDVAQAREEMGRASKIWRQKPIKERIRILRKLQKMIIDSVDIISSTINQDMGKSVQDGLIEVLMVVDRMHQYYKHAPKWLGRKRVPPGLYIFKRYYTEPQPYGVVGILGPWNYPFDLMMSPLCSALLAGNTVLLKPSEVTGATGLLVEKLIQSVPELSPFVRVLHGDGRVGAQLVRSRPDFIFLTGSAETGRKVATAAAEHLIPYQFELGGKDPMIVLEDADIKSAARWGVWGSCYNAGQTCQGIERVYVVASVYDEFVKEVYKQVEQLTVGYSPEKDCPYDVAPITFEGQRQIINEHLSDAKAKGAHTLIGGKIDGLYMEPTVLVDVNHSMKIMSDETFGPIMPIMKVRDEGEAIKLANDSLYGLSAAVWSGDLKRAQRVSHQLEVGSVIINDTVSHYAVSLLPLGGVKHSGSARTHCKQEVMQFTQWRSYAVGRPPMKIDLVTKMREQGHYGLGAATLRLAFGVTPRQRLQPISETLQKINQPHPNREFKRSLPWNKIAAGLLTSFAAIVFGLWRLKR